MSRRRIFSPGKVTFSVKIRKRCQLVKSAVFFLHFCELKNTVFFAKKNTFFFPKIVAFRRQITSFLFLPKMSTSIFWTKLSTIDQKKMTIHLQKFTASNKKKHVNFIKLLYLRKIKTATLQKDCVIASLTFLRIRHLFSMIFESSCNTNGLF